MSATPEECLARLLEDCRPGRLLVIGPAPVSPAVSAEVQRVAAEEAQVAMAEYGRFDFAIVAELAERLDAAAAGAVLGRLKNLHTDRYVLLVDPAHASLDRDALLALALLPLEQLTDGRIAWLYDIDRYNPERRWNNPDNWAHPQNFDRFRW